jgi:hypothetical protein
MTIKRIISLQNFRRFDAALSHCQTHSLNTHLTQHPPSLSDIDRSNIIETLCDTQTLSNKPENISQICIPKLNREHNIAFSGSAHMQMDRRRVSLRVCAPAHLSKFTTPLRRSCLRTHTHTHHNMSCR